MNANYLINMIIRTFMRKAVNRSIGMGIDLASRRQRPEGEMTQAEKDVARQAKQSARRARQAAKLTRRIGRM